jgi:hypothetical protein
MASLDADRAEIAAAIHRHKSNGPTTPPPTWLDRDEILDLRIRAFFDELRAWAPPSESENPLG